MKIGTEMAKGATWMVAFKFAERGLGIISTMILARLLVPADFGLIALATSFIAILELLSAFGFDVALIQNQNAERKHYDTAWTMYVIFGIVSAVLLAIFAIPVSHFYTESKLVVVMLVLALGSLIQGFENIGVVDFRKGLFFRKEFIYMLSKKVASFSVTIPAAFILQNYWALIIGILTNKLAGVTMSYILHPYRPKLSLAAIRELIHFSKWLLINNILYFLKDRSADFIMGKMVGTRGLGLYAISYEISNMPTTELVAPINRAVFPGYAKQSSDINVLRQGVIGVMGLITLFALPAGFGIASTAELLVPVVLGDKWLDTIPLMQVLAFYGAVTALQSNFGYIYIVIGKPRLMTAITAANVAVLIPMLLFMISMADARGAANAFLITGLLFLPVNYFLLHRNINLTLMDLVKPVWRPLIGAVTMYIAVAAVIKFLGVTDEISLKITYLALAVLTGVVVYVLVVAILWLIAGKPYGAEHEVLDKTIWRIRQFFGRADD
ncbi:MAG: lipopolysaccharide biosynthesis protein [Gammaproteobacteria bacterium]|nr:lipopolysaccharide biosynthesis protein [Gammaproteobacteria bacterium]